MSVERNKEVARRWFEEGISSNDLATAKALADEFFTDDFVDGDSENAPRSREEFKTQVVENVFKAFGDITVTVEDIIGEGDVVALRMRFVATHIGEYQGLAATGKRVEFTETGFSFFRGDRVYRTKGDLSLYRVMHELGASA
jgi:predicted ester cyclase